MALINKLEAIGDAIRAKNGSEDKYTLEGMVTAIGAIETGGGGGGADIEPVVLSGDCAYACAGKLGSEFIKLYGNKISTNYVGDADHMFYGSTVEHIPFAINFNSSGSSYMNNLFESCNQLKELPEMNNAYPGNISKLFYSCYNLRYLPENLGESWNWNLAHTSNSFNSSNLFQYCYSLRKIPDSFMSHLWGLQTSSYAPIYNLFDSCYNLDEINNLPVQQATLTTNRFSYTFDNCHRIKSLTFATNEDGTAKTAEWKSQTIDLSKNVGYASYTSRITDFNSGITAADKAPTADYQTFKAFVEANPDNWWTDSQYWARYDKQSAIETINSLPDTSAYLASKGGTNTIKFKNNQGSSKGEDISQLSAEQIAVATAKGWTVTFA